MMTVSTARAREEVRLGVEFGLGLANAYVEQSVTFRFEHEDGTVIERPGFWDGGRKFGCAFASPKGGGTWRYSAKSSPADGGIDSVRGEVRIVAGVTETIGARFGAAGF